MTQIDKTSVQDGLKSLIEQTYLIEREYKNLTASYANLQGFIKDIVEILPNAIWVLDEAGEIFLQNSEALKLGQILKFIPQNEGEIQGDLAADDRGCGKIPGLPTRPAQHQHRVQ